MGLMTKILRCALPLLALASCVDKAERGATAPYREMRAVAVQAQAPMNEMVWWEDADGRPYAVYSRASECEAQVLTLRYGADGRIESVTESADDEIGDIGSEDLDSVFSQYYDADCYLWYCRYGFAYRQDGMLESVAYFEKKERGADASLRIQAAPGHHLEAAIRPVAGYWDSDLNGGRMLLCVSEVADSPGEASGPGRRWIGCTPVEEIDDDWWEIYFTPAIDSIAMPEEHKRYPKTIRL